MINTGQEVDPAIGADVSSVVGYHLIGCTGAV